MAFDNKLYGKCRKISNNHIQKHGFLVSRIFGRLAETFGAEYSADLAETFGRIFGFGRTLICLLLRLIYRISAISIRPQIVADPRTTKKE